MSAVMSADDARDEIETWLTVSAENRPGDGDRMGVSYERAPLHRSTLHALLAEVARLESALAEKIERIRLARTEIMRVGLVVLPDQAPATQDVLHAALHAIETPLLADTKVVL